MGIGGLALLVLTGILGFVALLLVAPVRLRVSWGEIEKSLSVRYLGLSVEFDYARRCRRIRLLNRVIAASPWLVTSRAAPRKGRGDSHHAAQGGEIAGSRVIQRVAAKGRLLWRFRVALRRTLLIILRLAGRLIRAWHVDRADITLTAGLGDPAQTGMATGWFYAIWTGLSKRFPAWRVTWEPVFEDRVVRVNAVVVLRLMPVRAVYHLCQVLLSLPWRELWRLKKVVGELSVEGR